MAATIRDEYRALETLLPHPRNYNVHSEKAVQSLADAMRVVAYTAPIICKEDGTVLGGHARRLALHKLRAESYPEPAGVLAGWQVPCRVVECNEAEELKILATDNPDPAQIDYDQGALAAILSDLQAKDSLEGTWYDAAALDALIGELSGEPELGSGGGLLPEADPDEVPEDAPTRCHPGDLWQLGEHRLLCGDSTKAEDVARLLDGAEPALMVTDPPYGVEYDPEWREEAAAKGLIGFSPSSLGKVANDDKIDWREAYALFPGDVFYCWHADRHASEVQQSVEAEGFEIRCQIVWAKPSFAISRGHYNWQHEPCWYAVRKGATAHWQGDHSQSTLWTIGRVGAEDRTGHGTQKPVECMARAIRNHQGDVYEPFCGSGSTLIAAEQEGRRCYGMEITPTYCDVILARWEKATGRTAELLERVN